MPPSGPPLCRVVCLAHRMLDDEETTKGHRAVDGYDKNTTTKDTDNRQRPNNNLSLLDMEITTSPEKWHSTSGSRNRTTKQIKGHLQGNYVRSTTALSNLSWRNRRNSWLSVFVCVFMITIPSALTIFCWIALQYFEGSLFGAMKEAYMLRLSFVKQYAPSADLRVTIAYFIWVLFQAALYTVLPGRSTGQLTAGGKLLTYRTNGFQAWIITVLVFVLAALFGAIDLSIIAHHWGNLIVIFNIYGYALSIIAYLKAHYAPSHIEDLTFSGKYPDSVLALTYRDQLLSGKTGSVLYDFLMGIEFNPRFGQDWDWKLFHNGRPGIIGWTLMWVLACGCHFLSCY